MIKGRARKFELFEFNTLLHPSFLILGSSGRTFSHGNASNAWRSYARWNLRDVPRVGLMRWYQFPNQIAGKNLLQGIAHVGIAFE